ncbi:MAG: glutamine amidotransferase [Bacteroidetes bacterium]|nr:glutamine amidotransferase [Bacteroidota bacterium]
MTEPFTIAILLYDRFNALDVVGSYEVLSRIPHARVCMVGCERRLYTDDRGLQIATHYLPDEIVNPDMLVIPGGFGIDSVLDNQEILCWLRTVHATSKWTTSVCSGALLLAAAGLLTGVKATTHWNRKDQLATYGAIIEDDRYVVDGKISTSAGVSAGIDMSLYLLSRIVDENFAKTIQLAIEYDPQPPFDSGSPSKAPKELVDRIRQPRPANR